MHRSIKSVSTWWYTRPAWQRRSLAGPGLIVILFLVLNIISPLPKWKLERDYSRLYFDRQGDLVRITLSPSGKYRFKSELEDIPVEVREYLLKTEDRWFYYHPGINPVSIVKAMVRNIRAGRTVSGGSTITLQLAKLIEPRSRTYGAKLIETFRALQLELFYSKEEILTCYLNTVPMGGNIEGIGAASWAYFGKDASRLSLAEAAILAAIPNSPARNRPDRNPKYNKERKNLILNTIDPGFFKKGDLAEALALAYCGKKKENPMRLPHLVDRLSSGHSAWFNHLTIDPELQMTCEAIIAPRMKEYRRKGINNISLIVVNNSNMQVLAYIGNYGYMAASNGGMINCAGIRRSPGSTLKPFIYGRGIDQGMITPRRILFDMPRDYDHYNPANYSRLYSGAVRMDDALNKSLNTPAVYLEYRLGQKGLTAFLKKSLLGSDLYHRRQEELEKAWISAALGTFYLSVEELAELYAILANDGNYQKLCFYTDEEPEVLATNVLSVQSCYLISKILSENTRTDLPFSWEFTANRGRLAFKTGTSWSFKDAWTAVYNPDYTVVTWLGNASGKYSPYLTGRNTAALIAIEVMNHLQRYQDNWFTRPAGIAEREICPESGLVPGEYCPRTNKDLYLPGVSDKSICNIHKRLVLSENGKHTLCPSCTHIYKGKNREVNMVVWPMEYAWFLKRTARVRQEIPPHFYQCPNLEQHDKPKIIFPKPKGHYRIVKNLPLEAQRVKLMAYTGAGVKKVFWYYNRELVSSGAPEKVHFMLPKSGKGTVRVVDDQGREDSLEINIVAP